MKLRICFEKLFLLFVVLFIFGCNSSSGGNGSQDGRDTEAPSVPANLSASNSDFLVQISWTASTGNTAVRGYKIYRNGAYLAFSSTNSYIAARGQYCYTVSAVDEAGNESATGESVCVSSSSGNPEAPSVPANLSAFNSNSSVQISWTAPTDNTTVTGYKIYRNGAYLASSSTTSYTDSDITAAKQYCYTVSALDSAGNESANSGPACVATSNGRVKWRFETESSVIGSIAVDSNGTIYAVDEKNLYAIKPDGSLKWKFTPELEGSSFYNDATPVIGPDNTIYIKANNGVCALNMAGALIKETAYFCSAAGSDGAYYTLDAYILFSLNPDGTKKWSLSPGYQQTFTSPAIGQDGTVYTATYPFIIGHSQHYVLHAINPDGLEKWNNDSASFNTSPVIGTDGSLYVASKSNAYQWDSDYILALNQDGTIKWKTETGGFIGSSLTIDTGGTLYAMSKDGYLNALNPGGGLKWRCFTGVSELSPAIANDGTIYVGSSDKGVYAISSDSPGLDSNAWPRLHKNNGNTGILKKTVIDTDPPSVPTKVNASAIATTMVQLNWEPSTDNSTHIKGYNVYRDGICLGLKDKEYTDSGLSPSTRYCYRIAAVDAVGNESEKSTEICITTLTPADGVLKWKCPDWFYSEIAIEKDGSLITSSSYSLSSISHDGVKKWEYSDLVSGRDPSIGADGTIYIGNLNAFNSDGTILWKYARTIYSDSSPSISKDGTIYSATGNLCAVNHDGTLKWEYADASVESSSIGTDGTIYAHQDAFICAVNPDGTLKWNYRGYSSGFIPSAIGPDGTIYLVDRERGLSAIGSDGTLKWEFLEFSLNAPVIDSAGTIYTGTGRSGYFYAIKPDGTLKWKYQVEESIGGSAAIGSDGIVYFGAYDGYLYALRSDGTLKWKYQTGNRITTSPAIASDGTLYFGMYGDSGTYLCAIQTSSMGLATGGWPKIYHDNQNTGRMP